MSVPVLYGVILGTDVFCRQRVQSRTIIPSEWESGNKQEICNEQI